MARTCQRRRYSPAPKAGATDAKTPDKAADKPAEKKEEQKSAPAKA